MKKKVFLGYIPVISRGMLEMLRAHADEVKTCLIWGPGFIEKYRPLQKDIRALSPEDIELQIKAYGLFNEVRIVEPRDILNYSQQDFTFVMPDETETRDYADQCLTGSKVEFDSRWRLRWDKTRTLKMEDVVPGLTISQNEFVKCTMSQAYEHAQKSSDWWRQVGACIVQGGKVILWAYNEHIPSDHSPYIDGDVRLNFKAGENIESGTALHAEASLIVQAASRINFSLQGTELFSTTFPCRGCAQLIARSGITTCYFTEGYSNLDAQKILKDAGIELVLVDMTD